MHNILKNKINFVFIVFLAALLTLPLLLSSEVSFASAGESDTFEIVYPTANYFQSQTPTLVAANQNYLAVLDAPENRLYVRKSDLSTCFYDISSILTSAEKVGFDDVGDALQTPVEGIYVVGAHAFVALGVAPELELYSLDLAADDAQPQKLEVPHPDRIYCFASDGEKLYAKNVEGHIAIYDENLGVVKEDVYNYDVLPGKASIAGDDGVIYLFTTDEKNTAQLYVYDSNRDEITLSTPSKFIQTAYIGDVIYAQISPSEDIENHSKVVCLDKQTGEELYTSNFMPESFCAYGDKLYSVNESSVTGYRFKLVDGGAYTLEPEEILSMAGSDFKHLDSPKDLIIGNDSVAIADGDNMRIAVATLSDPSAPLTTYTLEERPKRIASSSDKVYALLESGKIVSFDAQGGALAQASVLNAPEDGDPIPFEDIICFDGELYAVTEDALYIFIANTPLSVARLDGAKRLTDADDGNRFYVLTDDEILMFGANNVPLPTKLTGDFRGAIDFAADYAGNLFVLFADRVEHYKNDIYALEKISETPLLSSNCKATATSCALLGGELYFSAQECFIGKMSVDSISKDGYIAPALPTPDNDTTYHFAKLKDGVSSCFIPAEDGRADSVIPATRNVLLVLDGLDAPAEGASYALDSDKLYIIRDEDYDAVQPTPLEDKAYLVKEACEASAIPYFADLTRALDAGTKGIRAVSDCAGYDGGKWWIVSLNGQTYFVDPALLDEDLAPPSQDDPNPDVPPEEKPLYGRAKAGRVGGTVNIYADVDESAVLTSVVDGKKVQILATLDGYYQVQYGDITGYMRASEVKIGGLTTVQIVAIVLSIVVLLAGTGIFISIYGIKKRNEPTEEDSN